MSELASAEQLRMSFVRVALVTVPLVLLLGVLSGALAGSVADNRWFTALAKPSGMPPAWTFPVVWAVFYIPLGFALAIVVGARRASGRGLGVLLFAFQLLLNLAWSPIFFAAHRIDIAFAVILAMIVLTLGTLLVFVRIRRGAALLMLLYLVWICFAAWLTHSMDSLNPAASLAAHSGAQLQLR